MRFTVKKIAAGLVAALALALSSNAMAVTECSSTVQNLWAGDSGSMYVALGNNMSFALSPTDPNLKGVFSLALLAIAAHNNVTVRFTANSVPCSGGGTRGDVVGMFIFPAS